MLYGLLSSEHATVNNFRSWLFSDAGAGWAAFALSILGAGIAYFRRKRPNLVMVETSDESSMIEVQPMMRDRVGITFDGQPIKDAGHRTLAIWNSGSDDIESALNIKFTLKPEAKVLIALLDEQSRALGAHVEIADNVIHCRLPYLNANRTHRQVVTLAVVTDGPTDMTVVGGDKGWSLRYNPDKSSSHFERVGCLMGALLALLSCGLIAYVVKIMPMLVPDDKNWKVKFLYGFPAFAFVILVAALLVRIGSRLPKGVDLFGIHKG